jgi:hypothetical protein
MKAFKEKLNTAVFTTKYVIQRNSSILYVYHYENGNWQFSGKENILDDEDYKVISLKEMIEIDPSILEISDLQIGFEAIRKTKNDIWQVVSDK